MEIVITANPKISATCSTASNARHGTSLLSPTSAITRSFVIILTTFRTVLDPASSLLRLSITDSKVTLDRSASPAEPRYIRFDEGRNLTLPCGIQFAHPRPYYEPLIINEFQRWSAVGP